MKKFLLLALFFTSCTARYAILEDVPAAIEQADDYLLAANLKFDNDMDRKIVTKSLYYMFEYIRQRFGEKDFLKFYKTALHGVSIPDSARQTFNQTFYGLLSEAYFLLKPLKYSESSSMISTNFQAFRIYYFPGSAAEKDLPMICYLLDKYFTAITNIFAADSVMMQRLKTNFSLIKENALHIYLFEDRSQTGSKSVADGYFSYTIDWKNDRFVPEVGLKTAYYNIISAYIFSHELTHLVMGLTGITRPLAPVTYSKEYHVNESKMSDALYKYIMPFFMTNIGEIARGVGNNWGEGVAEYITSKCNLYFRYGLLDNVNNDLRYYMKNGGKLTPVFTLVEKGLWTGYDLKLYRVHYQEMHSVAAFLVEKFGWNKLMEMIYSPDEDATFLRIYELSKQQISDFWLAHLSNF
jgi:hypothetical protein